MRTLHHKTLERETGIEPATNSLEGCDSTTELLPPFTFQRRPDTQNTSAKQNSPTPPMSPPAWSSSPDHPASATPPLPALQTKTSREGNGSLPLTPHKTKPQQWCTGEDSNLRSSIERQIYSLLPLTTRPPVRNSAAHFTSENRRSRTAPNHHAKRQKLSGTQQRSALAPWKMPK